jgi:hypothetical protein
VLLTEDADAEVRRTALETIGRIPVEAAGAFLARPDVSQEIRDFFGKRGVVAAEKPSSDPEEPLIDTAADVQEAPGGRDSVAQQIAKMGFSQRLNAAVKGTREMRTLLIRDPNKTVAAAVLSSPKLTEQEVETFARMANLPEDILRIIAANRQWMRNYGIVVGLTKNPKTPLALSLKMMARLTDRDLQVLSIDRNIPDPLRVAARRKVVAGGSKK